MNSKEQYSEYKKPSWAPPSWVFGPVWSLLYVLIAISFGYIFILFVRHQIGFVLVLPFLLNLVFNFLYTPLQFTWKKFTLAFLDSVLILVTLVWALAGVYGQVPWVAYINIPYVLWVCFATVLQFTVLRLNRGR